MLFGNDRGAFRRFYYDAWHKRREGRPLEPLEAMIADVVALHPEYHPLLADEAALEREFLPEGGTNPFLHMGLHIALREQLGSGRPAELGAHLRRLAERLGDAHAAEHRLMECLAETLRQAQVSGGVPDEAQYLRCLDRLDR